MKKAITLAIIIIVLALAGFGAWAYKAWNKPAPVVAPYVPLTPEQTRKILEDLDSGSAKPAEAPKVQESQIEVLETSSKKPAESPKTQEDFLKQLEAGSKH